MKQPIISIVMPVFNGASYLKGAISSILNQTMGDFEFIIINDGSTDSSTDIIRSFNDKRIIFYNCASNQGNYSARNIGIQMAKGKYISVMDCDDIALPHKLHSQCSYMEDNPNIGICGSFARIMGTNTVLKKPITHEQIKVALLQDNCIVHPTLLIRNSSSLKKHLNYNTKYYYASDYDFIARAVKVTTVVNLPKVLLEYRLHPQQISNQFSLKQKRYADLIRIQQLKNFKLEVSKKEEDLHLRLMSGFRSNDQFGFEMILAWANQLIHSNSMYQRYDQNILIKLIRSRLKKLRYVYD